MVEFPAPLNGFAFRVIVGKAHGGAVFADGQVNPVLMPAPVLNVEYRSEWLALQAQLGFQACPEVGSLFLGRKGLVGMWIEVNVVERLPGAVMCPQCLKLAHLGTKITLGDEAARGAKADLLVVLGVQQVPDQGGTARASGGTGKRHQASPS